MDKTNEKKEVSKFQETWTWCRRTTDLVALIGAAKEKNLPIPVEYYRLLDFNVSSLASYVKELLDYAESRDNE